MEVKIEIKVDNVSPKFDLKGLLKTIKAFDKEHIEIVNVVSIKL